MTTKGETSGRGGNPVPLFWLGLVTKIEKVQDEEYRLNENLVHIKWCGEPYAIDRLSCDYESNLSIVSKAKKVLDKEAQLELSLGNNK